MANTTGPLPYSLPGSALRLESNCVSELLVLGVKADPTRRASDRTVEPQRQVCSADYAARSTRPVPAQASNTRSAPVRLHTGWLHTGGTT